MANKYLKRRFTVRETILMCVLLAVLLVGLYVGLVVYPIQNRRAQLELDLEATAEEKVEVEATKAEYDRMKAELDRISEDQDDTIMPEHTRDHYLELLEKINTILDGIDHPVSNSSGAPQDGIVKRTVNTSFTITSANKGTAATVYEKARSVLIALVTETGYRCSMSSFTLSPGSDGLEEATSLAVSVTIEFFELA